MSARVMLVVRDPSGWVSYACGMAGPNEAWWLVEAESTYDARKVIEHFEHNGEPCVHGRVLANGDGR